MVLVLRGVGPIEFKDKIMLPCFNRVKCQQGYAAGILH